MQSSIEGSPIIQMDDSANGVYIRGNIWTPEPQDAGSLQLGRLVEPLETTVTLLPRLHIRGDGNVGIGTISPQAKLHVDGGQDNQWGMVLSSTGGSAFGLKIHHGWYGHPHIPIFQANALDGTPEGVPRFAIYANGNVGIGTTTLPGTRLDVAGTTRTGVLEITGGSDLAEPFDITAKESVIPGMVVAIEASSIGAIS